MEGNFFFYLNWKSKGQRKGSFKDFQDFCRSIKLVTPSADWIEGADRITWKNDSDIIDVLFRK